MEFHPVFFELHSQNNQEGPGSDSSTKRALDMIPPFPHHVSVLDIGCGPGRQTLFLAKHLEGIITAIDSHPPYIEQLKQLMGEALQSNIKTVCRPMAPNDFKENEFDLIWSEGTLYALGVEQSLKALKRILKNPGYVAFTELTLFSSNPRSPAVKYWKSAYPDVKSTDENLEMISRAGYNTIGHFRLSPSDWEEYYQPLSDKLERLQKKYSEDPAALQALQEDAHEIELYSKHGDDYGYVFYVLSKN